jgi:predicted secreted protein
MTTILGVLAVTVIFAIVVLLAVLRAGIRQQEDAGSLTRRPRGLSAAITRRLCGLHACLPERAVDARSGSDGPIGCAR